MSEFAMPHVWPTVVHMLDDAARRAPTLTALVSGDERISYVEYARCVTGLAAQLQANGLGKHDRVVVFMGNSIDTAIALYGVQAAGAQVVPLNPAYTISELNQVLASADARAIIHDVAVGPTVDQLDTQFEYRLPVDPPGAGLDAPGRLTHWHRDDAVATALPLPTPDMPSILQYTGGTTGVPKGVNLAHGAVSTNVSQREALVPTLAEQERVLAITPLYHSYAMAMGLYLACYARSTLVILPRYRPDIVLDTIAQERITLLLGSPTIFSGLMSFDGFATADLHSLRLCSSGSSALSEELLRRWESSTGCVVCEGYGQTESGPVLTYNPAQGLRKIGTVGVPVPETDIQIVDVETGEQVLPAGEQGEIRARGPQLMQNYYGMPQETAQALRNGWLYTGDIGRLDADGYLSVTDRKKEMVIVSGFNVYPREIEEALYRHPGVNSAAVIGVPDAYRGEILKAYVIARSDVTAQALQEFLADKLVKYKWPAQIEIVDSLPQTSVGKIDKKQLRAQSAHRH